MGYPSGKGLAFPDHVVLKDRIGYVPKAEWQPFGLDRLSELLRRRPRRAWSMVNEKNPPRWFSTGMM